MKITVIHGPNMNLLGLREPDIYGNRTYKDLCDYIRSSFPEDTFDFYQSNHEGDLIDRIQGCIGTQDAIVINPAAYTHTSIAIGDALRAAALPAVEVHLSDVTAREPFRKISYVKDACVATVAGKGFEGYKEAIALLHAARKETLS